MDKVSNLSLLRNLDLSYNLLKEFPSIITNLPEINHLNLAKNQIYDLNNSTLIMGVQKLIYLDLSYLPLMTFEVRKLRKFVLFIFLQYVLLFII